MFPRLVLGVLCAASVVLTACGPGSTELRLEPETGKQYRLESVNDVDMSIDLGPMGSQSVTNVVTLGLALEPLEVGAEAVRFAMKIERIVIRSEIAGETMEYDTDADTRNSPLAPLDGYFRALLDTDLEATITPRGEVLSVTGVEQAGRASDYVTDPRQLPVAAQFEGVFGAESLAATLQTASPVFPVEPVKIGDQWEHTHTAPSPVGNLAVVTTYTASEPEEVDGRRCLRLDVAQTMTTDGEPPMLAELRSVAEANGGSAELRLGELSGRGSVCVELATGLLVHGDLTSAMGARLDLGGVPGPGGEPIDVTVAMGLDGTTTIRRKD